MRTFRTTSTGRLFDTVAALLGFCREVTFEGQAAIWLEHLARGGAATAASIAEPAFDGDELDFRVTLDALVEHRRRGDSTADLAGAFHRALARGLTETLAVLANEHGTRIVVLSGGVFQNRLLTRLVVDALLPLGLEPWGNRNTPSNDGGVSLGQAALALSGHGAAT
jgi:hydrogenase maturation protein HypF